MAGPIQLQWGLEQSGNDAFAITKGLLKAATSDNVQIIALLACERFGNTLAMSPMTLRKVEKLMLPFESATMKYLKCTIALFKDDCATALGQSAAGLRFLGLAAALVTNSNPFEVAENLDVMLRESAKDLTLIPTVGQLHDLLVSLRPRAHRCGFADNVVGWETLTHREVVSRLAVDDSLENIEGSEMCKDILERKPNREILMKLLQGFREIGRTGDDDSLSLTIEAHTGLPWILAFTEWCVGTPALYYGDQAILQPENHCCKIVFIQAHTLPTLIIHQRMTDITRLLSDTSDSQDPWTGMLSLGTYGSYLLRRLGLQAPTVLPQVHGLLRRLIPVWSDALETGTMPDGRCFWVSVMLGDDHRDCGIDDQHHCIHNNHRRAPLSLPGGYQGDWQKTVPSVGKILEAYDHLFGGEDYLQTQDDDITTIQWLEAIARRTQGIGGAGPQRDLIGAKLLLGLPDNWDEKTEALQNSPLTDNLFMLFMEAACMAVVSSKSWPSLRFNTELHGRRSFRTESQLGWESNTHTQSLYQLILWWVSQMLGQNELSPRGRLKKKSLEDDLGPQEPIITAGSGQVVYHSVCQSTEVYCTGTSIELRAQPGSLRFRDQYFDTATARSYGETARNGSRDAGGEPSSPSEGFAEPDGPTLYRLYDVVTDMTFAELHHTVCQTGIRTLYISTLLAANATQRQTREYDQVVMMPAGNQKVFILRSCEHAQVEINRRDKQSLGDCLRDDWLPYQNRSSIFASREGKAWRVLVVHTRGNFDAQYHFMVYINRPTMIRRRGACIPCCMNACKELGITILCT